MLEIRVGLSSVGTSAFEHSFTWRSSALGCPGAAKMPAAEELPGTPKQWWLKELQEAELVPAGQPWAGWGVGEVEQLAQDALPCSREGPSATVTAWFGSLQPSWHHIQAALCSSHPRTLSLSITSSQGDWGLWGL